MEQNIEGQVPYEQTSEKRKKRIMTWTLWITGAIIVIILIVLFWISIHVGWSLTHPERKLLDDGPENYGLMYESIEVESLPDQIILKGWAIDAEEPKGTIILAHGYRGNRLESGVPALAMARDLQQNGFHVIMFDFRNSGESEGNLTTVGYKEKDDLISVVQYANRRYPDLPIGVIGFSMGASTSLVAAADEPLIKAVVADSPFADLKVYLETNLPYWSDLPNFPFTFIIMKTLPLLTGVDVSQVSPKSAVASLDIPIMLIHGDGDLAIPFQNSEEIFSSAVEGSSEFWIPEGSDHVKSYADYPEDYLERLLQFFDANLK